MTPEISEFSYGFALTNEIVGWANLKAAPIFPSLIEEGKEGGGYDVKLETPGVPLYLQFKRADCMTRRSAREISKYKARLSVPFYRFEVTQVSKSDQHLMLLELDDGKNEVFYAAPRFHKLAAINQAWKANEVAARSIFIRPSAIGPLDSESHHIAYDLHWAYRCSEPKPVEFVTAATLLEKLSSRVNQKKRSLREELPEFNASLTQAWERGIERVFKAGQLSGEESDANQAPQADPSKSDSTGGIQTRTPKPLTEGLHELRELADNAVRLFNAQLVIVQKAK